MVMNKTFFHFLECGDSFRCFLIMSKCCLSWLGLFQMFTTLGPENKMSESFTQDNS